MKSKSVSVLHLYPPQQQHIKNGNSDKHAVCVEVIDYCAHNQVKLLQDRLRHPVFAPIPHGTERFVFDEIITNSELFSQIHNTKCAQEIEVLNAKEVLDNLACDIVAGAHHGSTKLVMSFGAAGSGHGLLSFGSTQYSQMPSIGMLWSILDAVETKDEWPKVSCFQVEGKYVRDLLSKDISGTLMEPRTENLATTAKCLQECGITFLPINMATRMALVNGIHHKRRILAKWHAVQDVLDRTNQPCIIQNRSPLKQVDKQQVFKNTSCPNPRLQSVFSQVGLNNYLTGLDVCATTCVLIQLGPQTENSQILFVDIPNFANDSAIADYKPSYEMNDVFKQMASLKALFTEGRRDHLFAKIVQGCAHSLFAAESLSRDFYCIPSVQVSNCDREQTISILKQAGQFCSSVRNSYFDCYKKQELIDKPNLKSPTLGDKLTMNQIQIQPQLTKTMLQVNEQKPKSINLESIPGDFQVFSPQQLKEMALARSEDGEKQYVTQPNITQNIKTQKIKTILKNNQQEELKKTQNNFDTRQIIKTEIQFELKMQLLKLKQFIDSIDAE